MKQLIECVPNFSEGKDKSIIDAIASAIKAVKEVTLLDVDPGLSTNRTVMTFVGEPQHVIIAAFEAIKVATTLIDMRNHKGEHARMGATDVCPLIPIANISMEETSIWAEKLAEMVGNSLNYPVYMYEFSAKKPERKNLATIRAGEYEGLADKLKNDQWKPDFGPTLFVPKTGATVIGARAFLVAYNININTNSTRIANAIAFDVREAGRVKRIGHPVLGEIVTDQNGEPIRIPGTLKSVKAVGWYLEEFNTAQISMNLTDLTVAPLHIAFDEVVKSAFNRGVRVTGSELVGLVPLNVLTSAGKYFLEKQGRSLGVSEQELIDIAVKTLGLNELSPFKPEEKIIEYCLQKPSDSKLVTLSVQSFTDLTASEAPAPGGGSISALCGSLAAALTAMVGNLSSSKRGWEDQLKYFSDNAYNCQLIKQLLLKKVDEDTQAFEKVMEAFALPKNTEEEKKTRSKAIQNASIYALDVPLSVMELSNSIFPFIENMIEKGNPNSLSDVGVAALCAKTAVLGAHMNVLINASSIKDKQLLSEKLTKAETIKKAAIAYADKLTTKVYENL